MTKEEKELLTKVLCEQLPYGVQVEIECYHNGILKGIEGDSCELLKKRTLTLMINTNVSMIVSR